MARHEATVQGTARSLAARGCSHGSATVGSGGRERGLHRWHRSSWPGPGRPARRAARSVGMPSATWGQPQDDGSRCCRLLGVQKTLQLHGQVPRLCAALQPPGTASASAAATPASESSGGGVVRARAAARPRPIRRTLPPGVETERPSGSGSMGRTNLSEWSEEWPGVTGAARAGRGVSCGCGQTPKHGHEQRRQDRGAPCGKGGRTVVRILRRVFCASTPLLIPHAVLSPRLNDKLSFKGVHGAD